jgi:hypothetical protein
MQDERVVALHHRLLNVLDQMKPESLNESQVVVNASTVSQLNNLIKPYVAEAPDFFLPDTKLRCCPWPLLQDISIGVRSHFLKSGVTIIDAPGTTLIMAIQLKNLLTF